MTTRLTPEETRQHSIFTMLGREGAGPVRWSVLIVLAALAWLGGVAFLGPFRPTQVSRLVATLGPLDQIFWICVGVAVAIAVTAVAIRRWALGWAAATVAGYLFGFFLSGFLFQYLPPNAEVPLTGVEGALRFALFRLWFAGPIAIVLLLVWLYFERRVEVGPPTLGFGNWLVQSRDMSVREAAASWFVRLFGGYLLFVAILFVVIQLPVGFGPILSGSLWPLLGAVLIAAAANATAEEVVYRGFIQPAFIRYGGAGAGLWVQGLFFGVIHWGLGVGVLAALPVSLMIGFGSIVWGKAAYETRGLGWTIVAHFLVDVAIMAAYFVPH
jgi:membrane protease YdiL (CAAX protease family)